MGPMEKISFWAVLILVACSTVVNTVDILFFLNPDGCYGAGTYFNDTEILVCAIANGESVLFERMNDCQASVIYRGGGCDAEAVASEIGSRCYMGGGFTSGYWYQNCRRRSLLGGQGFLPKTSNKDCLSKPTGLVYKDKTTEGNWKFDTPNALDLMKDLKALPEGEKVNWFKAQGARYFSN